MSPTVIPIVPHAQWEREICTRCVQPGHCCTGFNRSDGPDPLTFWDDTEPRLPLHPGEPFVLLERWGQWTVEFGPDTGRTYSAWLWTCPKLGADGRCTIYEQRPEICRRYEPLTDGLCAMHPGHKEAA